MKHTKKALLTSALCLLLCMSMLIGTTFAWFTDSVSTTNNIITAGNLDVNLYWSLDANTWSPVDAGTNIFKENALWEPGHTEVVYLKVVNEGTLALKYSLDVTVAGEQPGINVADKAFKLSDYILYNVFNGVETYVDSADARGNEAGNKLNAPYNKAAQLLEKGEEDVLTMVVFMPTAVGNEANYKTGTTVPFINMGINLFATQYTHEEDGFDKFYDGAIAWNGGVDYSWYDPDATELTIGSAEELAGLAAITNGVAEIADDFAGKIVKLASNVDLANLPWTPIADPNADGYVGFAGTFDGQGYTINNLYIDSANWGMGLFGYLTADVTIQNVNVNNASISAADEYVGVIAAYSAKGNFSNIQVTGDVNVEGVGAVGGVVGHSETANFDNCDVIADAGSSITAAKSFAGGIVGYHGNKAASITNCDVENLTITAYGAVGGIAGILGYGNTVDACSVKNVVLNKTRIDGNPSVGIFTGSHSYNNITAITLTNSTADNVVMNGTAVAYAAYNELYGSDYSNKGAANFVEENNTVTNITNNVESIIAANPSNVQSVINTAQAGDEIVLTAGEYHNTIVMKSGITLKGSEGAVVDCINLNGASNVTLKGISFDAAGAKYSYNASGKPIQPANIISRSNGSSVAGAANIVIEDCIFNGTFADGGVVIAFTDQGTTGYSNITVKGCEFDVTGGYTDIYVYYSGNNGSFVIENNTFSSTYAAEVANMLPIYLANYQSGVPVVVKNNDFQNKANFAAATYLKDHSNYGVSFDAEAAATNTFAN